MVERGLIERVDGAERAIRHQLTPAGDRARTAGTAVMRGVFGDSLGRLTAAERTMLADLLRKTDP